MLWDKLIEIVQCKIHKVIRFINMNEEWKTIEHALNYLSKADSIPHRTEGESALLEEISPQSKRILDLGAGDGRLLRLVLLKCPNAYGVALDFSPGHVK